MAAMPEQDPTPYDAMGGAAFFDALVRRFYEGVADDPVLRPMYPDDDLAPAERRLRLFLTQYWGGPTTYGDERGHPRLRMRHAPFPVDDTARDHWLAHMRAALDATMAEQGLDPAWEQQLWRYLVGAAIAMVNTESPAQTGPAQSDPAPIADVQERR
ncbi:MAG: globin [Frankiales bacterium]|nr:globin [Frankiales bacterium]